MDVFHKVLLKVYELTGGRENVEADLTDLLKREGYLSNIDPIDEHLAGEGWVTPGSRKYCVKMTHWGVAEARRVLADAPDKRSLLEKQTASFLSDAKQLVIMSEELSSSPSKEKLANVTKRVARMSEILENIGSNL